MIHTLERFLEWGGVKKAVTCLVFSGIALLVSIFDLLPQLPFDAAWAAVVLCGIPIILEAVIGLVTAFDIKADVLVSIALIASLIIGETLLGRGSIPVRIVGVIFGSCLYRVIVAIAMRFNLPASALKLVSALIVAIAIASPTLRQLVGFQKLKWKRKAQYGGKTEKAAAGTEKEEK